MSNRNYNLIKMLAPCPTVENDYWFKDFYAGLHPGKYGYVRLNCGSNRHGIWPPSGVFNERIPTPYLSSKQIGFNNRKISLGTYYVKGDISMSNLRSLNGFAINIETSGIDEGSSLYKKYYAYQDHKNGCIVPRDHANCLIGQWRDMPENARMPLPNFVIYGHTIQILYIFKEPVYFKRGMAKEKRSSLNWIEFMQRQVCDFINNNFETFTATPEKLNSSVRTPYSSEVKYYRKMVAFGVYELDRLYCDRVYVDKVGDSHVMTAPELSNKILPPLPDWYDSWKHPVKKVKSAISISDNPHSFHDVMERRLKFLEAIQADDTCLYYADDIQEMEKNMCFIYFNTCLAMGLSEEETRKRLHAFNMNFDFGYNWKKIERFKYDVIYKYRNDTILSTLHIPAEVAEKYGFFSNDKMAENKKAYNRAYSKAKHTIERKAQVDAGKAKFQAVDKASLKAKALRKKGLTASKIAKAIGKSIATVYRYFSRVEKSLEIEAAKKAEKEARAQARAAKKAEKAAKLQAAA